MDDLLNVVFVVFMFWVVLLLAIGCGDANKIRIQSFDKQEISEENKFTIEEFCYKLYNKQKQVDKCIGDLNK